MKITMIGYMGVGKTTYMASMYRKLGREGVGDFRLKADRDLDIRLSNIWEKIHIHGQWPESTPGGQLDIMKFKLLYGLQHITDFEFVDYRGGAIKDTLDKTDAAQLYKHVLESNALLVLVDSWFIANTDPDIAEARNQVNNIQNIIDDFLDKYPYKPLTIAILLTKIDAVTQTQFSQFEDKTLTLFKRLVTRIKREHTRLRGTFIPITVAGFRNVAPLLSQPQGKFGMPTVDMRLVDRPTPAYVHWPVLYAVAKELEIQKLAARERMKSLRGESEVARLKANWWDSIDAKVNNRESQRAKFERLDRAAESERRTFERLIDKLDYFVGEVAALPEIAYHDMIFHPRL